MVSIGRKRKAHVGGVEVFHAGPPTRRSGSPCPPASTGAAERHPAAFDNAAIGLAETVGHCHRAVVPPCADRVADSVERREFARGKRRGAFEDGIDRVGRRVGEAFRSGKLSDADDLVEDEAAGRRTAQVKLIHFSLVFGRLRYSRRPMPPPAIRPADDAAIAEAARLILDGQPVAVPTETVYGLAADATNAEAVARIYAAKGRPSFNPLIVHVLDLAAAERIGLFDAAARVAGRRASGPGR